MASRFGAVLDHMTRVPGIVAAILMKLDGSITEQSVLEGLEAETLRARAWDLFSRWESVGEDMGLGRPRMVVSTTADGPLSLIPVAPDAVLLAMGNRGCTVGRIRHELRRAGDAVRQARGVPQTPGVPQDSIPDLRQMMSEMASTNGAGPSERTIERGPDGGQDAAAAGEIVVVGVHTFRLALKIVTAVARARGVRSATLKTYEPPSITIEVAAESAGTLASIDGSSFGDCSLHLIARTESRLVLAVPEPIAPTEAVAGRAP